MTLRSIITIFIFAFVYSNATAQELNVSYVGKHSLPINSLVKVKSKTIGKVIKNEINKTGDSLYAIIRLEKGIRIPIESEFIVFDNFMGSSFVTVNYSTNKNYLKQMDIVIAKYRITQEDLKDSLGVFLDSILTEIIHSSSDSLTHR